MKKKVVSVLLVLIGSGMWWSLANTARFSIKKWDAKFGSVFRSTLNDLGVSDKDWLASVNEVKRDADGEWVIHHTTVRLSDAAKQARLREALERSGARVESVREGVDSIFIVKRGARVYQKIRFVPA